MESYVDSLTESVKKINDSVERSMASISSSLGDAESMVEKISVNSKLRDLYAKYGEEISNYDEKAKGLLKTSEELQEKLGITKEDLEKANELIKQWFKIEEEIKKLNEEIAKTSGEEADNLGLIVLQKEEELEKIIETANKSATVYSAFSSYFKNDEVKQALDEINETYEEID